MTLSVAIITKDEELNISECLESVSFADEIIVLDCNSTDRTCEIAKDQGAHVFRQTEWLGFGPMKNLAISKCSHPWVLSIDADERVPIGLKSEILEFLSDERGYSVCAIPRISFFCGRFLNYSGWRPDYVERLFKKAEARFSNALVHERLVYHGELLKMKNELIHFSFRDLEAVLHKINTYSSLYAKQHKDTDRRVTPLSALGHGCWTFFRTFVLYRGFMDGWRGFILSISNAEGAYYKYLKLWLAHNGASRSQTPDSSRRIK